MKKMKLFPILFLFLFSIITWGCDEELEAPDGCYTLSVTIQGETLELTPPYTIEAGQEIAFTNCGDADFYAFFSGIDETTWENFKNSAGDVTGEDTEPTGDVDFTYTTPGQYVTTIVLTNRSVENPRDYKQLVLDFEITVNEATQE